METITLEHIHKDLVDVKSELRRLSSVIEEDFELSESTKKELEEARKEPLSSYVAHEKVLKEFLE